MITDKPGKINERITLLGRRESCVYHLDCGSEAVILGGGFSYIISDVLEQVKEFGIIGESIGRAIILHSHFDHCGIIPYLKQRWPWICVTASKRSKELLSDPKILQTIALYNKDTATAIGRGEKLGDLNLLFGELKVEKTVGEGDIIHCGDIAMHVLEVPGHSSCSIGIYIPSIKALFVSDAAGMRYRDYFMPTGNSNFDLYQKNLERIAGLDVDMLLFEHYGVSTGDDVKTHFSRSIARAKEIRSLIEETYIRTRDVTRSAEEIVRRIISEAPEPFMRREILLLAFKPMVKYIAKTIQE